MSDAVSIARDGTRVAVPRSWVGEAPVALEFNGVSYAVMMATPDDLEDFATGFALTEGLAANAGEVTDIAVAEVDLGWIVRAGLSGLGADRMTERARARISESSCGLCGMENLEAVARPLPGVARHPENRRKRDLQRAGSSATIAAFDARNRCGPCGGVGSRRWHYRLRAGRCWPAQCARQTDRRDGPIRPDTIARLCLVHCPVQL